MHPHYDGSVHLSLPPEVAKAAQGAGWGLFDVRTGTFLMYGPRDWDELAVEWAFVNCSYRFARDLPDPNALLIEDVSD
jgi:phospholipase/carboxylesterase